MFKQLALSTAFVLSGYVGSTTACSNIVLEAQDGTVMAGRTLEFGPDLNSAVVTSPQGTHFVSPGPSGQSGLTWDSKYGYVFFNFFAQNNTLDGMNEKGLSAGYLYLPGYTTYPTVPTGKEGEALSYLYLGDWVLGNFSTVDEVASALKNITIYAEPKDFGPYKSTVFPLHLIISDATGKSITIEFYQGKMYVYTNKNGVLTNSPGYPWQIINQLNYVNLSPYLPAGGIYLVGGIPYAGTGQGAGSVGLPGDFTPPSRFTKLTFLTKNVAQATNFMDLLNLEEHILNNVDIPKGAVRGVEGDNEPVDTTQWTTFKDLTHGVLYFKSYQNTTLQSVDLKKLNLSKGAKPVSISVSSPQMVLDATNQLK